MIMGIHDVETWFALAKQAGGDDHAIEVCIIKYLYGHHREHMTEMEERESNSPEPARNLSATGSRERTAAPVSGASQAQLL